MWYEYGTNIISIGTILGIGSSLFTTLQLLATIYGRHSIRWVTLENISTVWLNENKLRLILEILLNKQVLIERFSLYLFKQHHLKVRNRHRVKAIPNFLLMLFMIFAKNLFQCDLTSALGSFFCSDWKSDWSTDSSCILLGKLTAVTSWQVLFGYHKDMQHNVKDSKKFCLIALFERSHVAFSMVYFI